MRYNDFEIEQKLCFRPIDLSKIEECVYEALCSISRPSVKFYRDKTFKDEIAQASKGYASKDIAASKAYGRPTCQFL